MIDLFMFKGRAYPVEEFKVNTETDYSTVRGVGTTKAEDVVVSSKTTIKMVGIFDRFMQKRYEPTVASLHIEDGENIIFNEFRKTMIETMYNNDKKSVIEATCENYDKILN